MNQFNLTLDQTLTSDLCTPAIKQLLYSIYSSENASTPVTQDQIKSLIDSLSNPSSYNDILFKSMHPNKQYLIDSLEAKILMKSLFKNASLFQTIDNQLSITNYQLSFPEFVQYLEYFEKLSFYTDLAAMKTDDTHRLNSQGLFDLLKLHIPESTLVCFPSIQKNNLYFHDALALYNALSALQFIVPDTIITSLPVTRSTLKDKYNLSELDVQSLYGLFQTSNGIPCQVLLDTMNLSESVRVQAVHSTLQATLNSFYNFSLGAIAGAIGIISYISYHHLT